MNKIREDGVDIMKGNPKSKAEISPNLIFTSEPNIEGNRLLKIQLMSLSEHILT